MSAAPAHLPSSLMDPRDISSGVHAAPAWPFAVHLVEQHLKLGDDWGVIARRAVNVAPDDMHEAVARYGVGLDHDAGEQPLAMVHLELSGRGEDMGHYASYVLTDRRMLGRVNTSDVKLTFSNIPYDAVTGARFEPRILGDRAHVTTAAASHTLYLRARQLCGFFQALATIPPDHRRPRGPEPLAPSDVDPCGVWSAMQRSWTQDVRTHLPFRVLHEAHRRGIVSTEDAKALLPRLMMVARGVLAGRACKGEAWACALPRPVLAQAMGAVLGAPVAHYPAQGASGHEDTLDYLGSGKSDLGRAVASSAVGLALLATVGVGWVSFSTQKALGALRVVIRDAPWGCSFQLYGAETAQWLPLSLNWWRTVNAIHQTLFQLETRYLLALAALGPALPFDQLIGMPQWLLERHVAHLVGPVDLRGLFPQAR
jgi:hypothetical protein